VTRKLIHTYRFNLNPLFFSSRGNVMINQKNRLLFALPIMALFSTVATTAADGAVKAVLSVNFQAEEVHVIPPDADNPAGVVPAKFWNNSAATGLSTALLNDGSSHPITVGLNADVAHTQIATPLDNDQRLMGGSYDRHDGTVTLSVANLPTAFAARGYDVYLYLWGKDNPNQQGLYEIGFGGEPKVYFEQTIDTFTGFDNSGQAATVDGAGAANFVKLAGVGLNQSEFTIEITNIRGVANEAYTVINGFQVVAIPEPGAALFLAASGLAFSTLSRRRR
jgi:hypothetical protein